MVNSSGILIIWAVPKGAVFLSHKNKKPDHENYLIPRSGIVSGCVRKKCGPQTFSFFLAYD
jgi:hypothetical protein